MSSNTDKDFSQSCKNNKVCQSIASFIRQKIINAKEKEKEKDPGKKVNLNWLFLKK